MSNTENIPNPFMSIEIPFQNNNNFYEEEQRQADKAMNEIRLEQSYNLEKDSVQQEYQNTFSYVESLTGQKEQIVEDYNGAVKAGVDTLQEYSVQKAMPKSSPYDFKRLEEYAPVTAEAYRNNFYDSVSMQDYLPELAKAEQSYKNVFHVERYYKDVEENAAYGTLDAILASVYEGTDDVLRGAKSLAVSGGSNAMNSIHKTVGLAYELIDPEQAKFLESFNLQNINEEQIAQLGKWLADFWGDGDEKANLAYQDIIRTINKSLNNEYKAEDVLPETDLTKNYEERLANSGTVNEFIGNVAQVIPQIALAIGAGALTGGGAWAAGGAAFLNNWGMSLDSYNKDPLANKDRKELGAFLNAAAQTPLEFIGLKGIFKAFKPKSSVGIAFKDWIMGSAVEGGTEYFQSYPELIAQEFVRGKNLDEMDDVADILNILFSWQFQKDALYQGAVGAAGGGVFGSVGAIGTLQNERAKAKNLVDITSNLEFAKKYPALFKARMEEHIEHGTIPENMFVQAVKIDGLFQSVEETGITKPEIDVFLEQAGIDKADYEEALKTGGTVNLPTANIPLLLETEKGKVLLQEISASSVNETTGTQEVLTDLEKSKKAANTEEKIFTPVDEYLLEQEYNFSDEEMADYEARNAEIQQRIKEQEAFYNNEEQDLKLKTAQEIINATKNTERPYRFSEAMDMAEIIDATLENISKNSGLSKAGAYKRFAPHFIGRFATQEQLDETIRNIKTDRVSSAANVFNPHAVTNFRRSKGYKQELAELKKAPLEELNGVYAMIKAVGDKIRITKAVTEYGEQYKEARRRMPRLFSKTQGRDYDDWRDVAKSHGYTDDLDDFGHILEMIANAPTKEEIVESQKNQAMIEEDELETLVENNLKNIEKGFDPDELFRQEEALFDELDERAMQNEILDSGEYEALYQSQEEPLVRDGITRKPDSETVKVVTLTETHAPEFAHMKEFVKWVQEMLAEGGNVVISSTGETARFTNKNVRASAKRARAKTHRDAYLALRKMIENAEYDHYEPKDERHPNSGGQDVYYSALNMGGKLYSVKIKLDVITEEQRKPTESRGEELTADVSYKDHKLTEIEIAPTLYQSVTENSKTKQELGAISNVSLGVIRGNVKPSGISENVLYQLAYHGTPHNFDTFSLDSIGTGEGAQAHGWGLYFAKDKSTANRYKNGLGINITLDGKLFYNGVNGKLENSTGNSLADDALLVSNGDIKKAMAELQEDVDYGMPNAADGLELLKSIKKNKRLKVEKNGQLFEVDIPENDVLLDEQKPFTQQNKNVKKLLLNTINAFSPEEKNRFWQEMLGKKLGESDRTIKVYGELHNLKLLQQSLNIAETKSVGLRNLQKDNLLEHGYTEEQIEEFINNKELAEKEKAKYDSEIKKLEEQYKEEQQNDEKRNNEKIENAVSNPEEALQSSLNTGEKLYKAIAYAVTNKQYNYEETSKFLNQHGIKGITYDGNQDGRCFVVFDDKAISVLEKFYQEQKKAVSPRAAFMSVSGAKGIIQFFQATDITSAAHEIGHWLRFVLEESAKLPYASGAKSEDYKTACEFVGAKPGEKWTREQEEKFAEEFVKYLSKGKAPSNKLKSVFNNLKNLFVSIYKKIRGNVPVSKEMAEVFDRLLATEKEIKLARQKTGTVEVNNPASRYELDTFVYMNPEQKETWESLRQKANEEAEEAMHDKLMKEYQAEKKKWKGEGRKIANDDVDHKRLAMIIEKGGIYLDEETREQYKSSIANITNKWKRTIFTDKKIGSMDVNQAAELYEIEGMNSTGNLIAYIESMPTKKQMVNDYVAKKSAEWENSWKAEEVVLTDSVSELLGVEADSLAKAVGVSSVSGRALRKMVKDTVAAREVGSIENPVEKLIQVSKENARLAKAYLKMKSKSEKNMKLALEYKEKQRIAVEQIRERYAIKEMRDKALKKIKRVLKANKDKAVLDRNYFNMYHALAYKFGLTDKAPEVETLSIMEFIQNEQNNDAQFELPEWLAALPERSKINYKKLSVDKFQDVMRVLTYLETRGKTLNEYKTDLMKADLNLLAKDCVESMRENLKDKKTYDDIERQKSFIAKLSGIGSKLMADIRGIPYVIEAMDGYRKGVDKINGIHYKAMLEPLYNAESEKITMVKDVFDKLEIILEPLKNMSKAEQTKRWAIPEVPLSEAVQREWGELAWNKQRVYMVALNMGNSGNIEALKNGYGWTDEDLKTITSYLSKEEWTMIQQLWDLIDDISPELNKVYEELTGMPMKKVEAEPVETPFGILRGGYFPIVYDSRLSDVAYQREIDDINRQTPSMFAGAKVKDGFTKTRKGGGKLAVKLSMDVLESHLMDTIHYTTHAIPVSNIRKLINHQYFKENFVRKFGNDTYKAMDSWLKYIARPEKERLSGLESVAEAGRHLATIYAMGLNVTTATLAFSTLSVSANEIGYKNVLVGLKYILQNRQEAYNAITKLSPYMANRPKDFQHEVKKNLQKYSPTSAPTFETSIMGKPVKIYMKDMETVAFKLMSFMDSIVAYSTWYGAYQKAMAETNGDMQRSITYADRIVDTTQSSGSNINLTEVQRKSVYTRILALFMTFTINFENRLINKIGEAQAKNRKISAKDYILWSLNEITLPVIATVLIRAVLNGDDLPEEPEDYWKQLGKEHLYYLVSGIPVMRNVSSVLDWNSSNLTGNSILDKQIVNLMKSPQKAYKALFEDGDMESFIKTSIDAGSFITGIPAHRVYQYFNRSYDLLERLSK